MLFLRIDLMFFAEFSTITHHVFLPHYSCRVYEFSFYLGLEKSVEETFFGYAIQMAICCPLTPISLSHNISVQYLVISMKRGRNIYRVNWHF